jgi:hypothetical protein
MAVWGWSLETATRRTGREGEVVWMVERMEERLVAMVLSDEKVDIVWIGVLNRDNRFMHQESGRRTIEVNLLFGGICR